MDVQNRDSTVLLHEAAEWLWKRNEAVGAKHKQTWRSSVCGSIGRYNRQEAVQLKIRSVDG